MAGVDKQDLFTAVLRLADDHLVLGHRISEWCGHAPMLEEDLAMPNMALDLIGQARSLYQYAAEIEGKGQTEDDLAYMRRERDYVNCLLVERPNGDFAHTMLKHLWFAAFMEPYWKSVMNSSDETLAAIAAKAIKEVAYHIRHAGEWVIRLGDGTSESALRMATAVEALEPYLGELFEGDAVSDRLAEAGLLPDPASLCAGWERVVGPIFAEAGLEMPEIELKQRGGRAGMHGEAMGFLLADLQHMQRTYPGAQW